jgi:transcriptional regulator with XRE-family HTH domain
MTETPIGPLGVDELIGERVHAAMWRARITQTQLARELGLDQAAVNRRLRGRTPWKVSDVVIAARALGVSVEDLMPRHDEIGHVAGLTRRNVAAESTCIPARAERRRRRVAAQQYRSSGDVLVFRRLRAVPA